MHEFGSPSPIVCNALDASICVGMFLCVPVCMCLYIKKIFILNACTVCVCVCVNTCACICVICGWEKGPAAFDIITSLHFCIYNKYFRVEVSEFTVSSVKECVSVSVHAPARSDLKYPPVSECLQAACWSFGVLAAADRRECRCAFGNFHHKLQPLLCSLSLSPFLLHTLTLFFLSISVSALLSISLFLSHCATSNKHSSVWIQPECLSFPWHMHLMTLSPNTQGCYL